MPPRRLPVRRSLDESSAAASDNGKLASTERRRATAGGDMQPSAAVERPSGRGFFVSLKSLLFSPPGRGRPRSTSPRNSIDEAGATQPDVVPVANAAPRAADGMIASSPRPSRARPVVRKRRAGRELVIAEAARPARRDAARIARGVSQDGDDEGDDDDDDDEEEEEADDQSVDAVITWEEAEAGRRTPVRRVWDDEDVAVSRRRACTPPVSIPVGETLSIHSSPEAGSPTSSSSSSSAFTIVDSSDELSQMGDIDSFVDQLTADSSDNECIDEAEYTELDDDGELFDPWEFIRDLPPLSSFTARPPALPQKHRAAPELTLVLDLDETLVHCTCDPNEGRGADVTLAVVYNGAEYEVFARLRPHILTFLERLHARYEIIVFTASQQVYAEKVLDLVDPERRFFAHRLFREHCLMVEGNYIKDLTVLGRDLAKTIIVDNSPQAFGFHLSNGIPIESFYDDPTDQELIRLLPLLERLSEDQVEDVRHVLRSEYRLDARIPPLA